MLESSAQQMISEFNVEYNTIDSILARFIIVIYANLAL